jgi:hypothetical protein
MKTPQEIVKILHSIKNVRLDSDNCVEVLFDPPSTTFEDGWDPNVGFKHNSFTRNLLNLIEAELNGELSI